MTRGSRKTLLRIALLVLGTGLLALSGVLGNLVSEVVPPAVHTFVEVHLVASCVVLVALLSLIAIIERRLSVIDDLGTQGPFADIRRKYGKSQRCRPAIRKALLDILALQTTSGGSDLRVTLFVPSPTTQTLGQLDRVATNAPDGELTETTVRYGTGSVGQALIWADGKKMEAKDDDTLELEFLEYGLSATERAHLTSYRKKRYAFYSVPVLAHLPDASKQRSQVTEKDVVAVVSIDSTSHSLTLASLSNLTTKLAEELYWLEKGERART